MVFRKLSQPGIKLLTADRWEDYELADSGNGLKLERFGKYTFIRPEHQAVWTPVLDESVWNRANARFMTTNEESGGHWRFNTPVQESWMIRYRELTFTVRPSNSRHLGVFPEQAVHWDWIEKQIKESRRYMHILNLFGYTGIASLAAAKVGARVTQVDASKKAISQARENQKASGLDAAPIRWIVDDALKFVRREVRRGAHYDGIILDPPKFGRGPKGEVWEFFEMLPVLLKEIHPLFGNAPTFLIMTAYAIRSSALTLHYAVEEMMRGFPGKLEISELVVKEKSAGRQISLAIFARWSAQNALEESGGRQE